MRKKLSSYFKKYTWAIIFYILFYIAGSACSVLTTIFSAQVIENITLQLYQKAMYMGLLIMLMFVVSRAFWWACSLVYEKYSSKIMMDLNYDLSRQAFKLNSKTYSDHNTGTFVQRIVGDPNTLVDRLASIVEIILDLVTSLVILIYIATLNVWVSLALVVLISICTVIETIRLRLHRRNKKISQSKSDKVRSLTTEIVRSEKDIKSMGLEDKLSETSKHYYQDFRDFNYNSSKINLNLRHLRALLINVGVWATLLLGIFLMEKALIGVATFMIIYSNRGSVFTVVNGIGSIGNYWAEAKVACERMFALFDEDEFVTEKFGNLNLEDVSFSTGGGSIEFDKVGYTYYEYQYADITKLKKGEKVQPKVISENHIFDNLSFKIESNTTVAFVGKSGSGKSTILNLMSKLFEVESGQVLINGVNINDLSKESLRRTISLVNQFPYIFDMSIKENLLLAKRDATEEEISNAIKNSCLDEFISSLPLGLETKVGESGIKLSGGQKQRVAIARALLRNSPIIIFDESTSSLDNFAQGEIKKSIDNLKGKSTVVIVAHRLSTIKDVDKIYFLDEGKIVDSGTFDELFEKNEKFKAMFLAENI